MTPKRCLFLLATLLALLPPFARAASTHHETDDPDLVYDAGIGDLAGARAILAGEGKPDVTDDQGHTALMRAAEHDKLGKTALIWAAEGGDGDVIDSLIKRGAKIEQAAKTGITPLIAAARDGQAIAIIHLLAAGAQPDHSDYSGRDPLSWAQEGRNPQIIDLIRKAQKR